MKLTKITFIGLGLSSLLFLANCNEVDEASFKDGDQKGALSFYLKDAPSDELKSVFVNIDSIQIFYEREGKRKRYDMVNEKSQLVDLMTLRDGIALKIKEIPFASDVAITSLRLVLNPNGNSAIRLDDSVCDLKTPSAQQSGLKIKLSNRIRLEEDSNYSLVLDFDVDRSVVVNSQKCLLKPVLKLEALLQSQSGDVAEEDDDTVNGEEDSGSSDDSSVAEDNGAGESDSPEENIIDSDDPQFDYTDEEAVVDVINLPGDDVLSDSDIIQESEVEEDAPISDDEIIYEDFGLM